MEWLLRASQQRFGASEVQDLLQVPALRRRSVVGSPRTVRAGLERHAAAYEVDEIMAVTICYDFEKRKRSYELLAEEFGLS